MQVRKQRKELIATDESHTRTLLKMDWVEERRKVFFRRIIKHVLENQAMTLLENAKKLPCIFVKVRVL